MNKRKPYKYLLSYVTPLVVGFSLCAHGVWTFTALLVLFGAIPILEMLTTGQTKNLSPEDEEAALKNHFYDWVVYGMVPVQYGLLLLFLFRIGDPTLSPTELTGMTIAMGLSCGVLGINVAHELGHRLNRNEQFLSKALLLTSQYLHFFIEHNRGHHLHVATQVDPASARYGEHIYAFFFRSIFGSWKSAWQLESKRLRLAKKPFWRLDNEMLRFQFIQVVFLATIAIGFGIKVLLLYFIAALIGILLLETVNYIEHYGLTRKQKGDRFERTMPIHSWNSNHPIGRLLLFELSRHSDHHYISSRKYQVLRHFNESPQMPTGYPGMMLLALIPPLWFGVMHRSIRHYRNTDAGRALA
jgi:alkane 1-monooxygenase